MDIFIYFYEPIGYSLDELEDALDVALAGVGEVTGAGTGERGSNLDVSVSDETLSEDAAVNLIRSCFSRFALPASSRAVINGVEFGLT